MLEGVSAFQVAAHRVLDPHRVLENRLQFLLVIEDVPEG